MEEKITDLKIMDSTEKFKKQQSRDRFSSFTRKFIGLGKKSVQLAEKSEKKSTGYIIFTIIYFAIVIGICLYAVF